MTNARYNQWLSATHLGAAVALLLGSFLGCAGVLGIEQWQDPPAVTGAGSAGGAGGAGGAGSSSSASSASSGGHHTSTGADGSGGPTCADGILSDPETDIDCGGDSCPPCALGQHCQNDADCSANRCKEGVCVPAPVGPQCEPSDAGATCAD